MQPSSGNLLQRPSTSAGKKKETMSSFLIASQHQADLPPFLKCWGGFKYLVLCTRTATSHQAFASAEDEIRIRGSELRRGAAQHLKCDSLTGDASVAEPLM